jgi:hypothetical protein
MDNAAVRQASGYFTLWCDSDDWLLPEALKMLRDTWESIPEDQRDSYVGLSALAASEEGCIVNPFPETHDRDVSWNDLSELHKVTRDMLYCARSDSLKAHPFPEVDLLIPESVVWTAIGHQPARLISQVLQIKEYQAAHSVSFTGVMAYNRGRAHALAATVRKLRRYEHPWKLRSWRLITFIRYSLHGELTLGEARQLWGDNSSTLQYFLAFPLAFSLAVKDRWQGKVRLTHREFMAAQRDARLIVERLSDGKRG